MEFSKFKQISYAVAQSTSATVTEFYESGITPNFAAVEIFFNQQKYYLVCSNSEHWAICSKFDQVECLLTFTDCEPIGKVLREQFEIMVLSTDLLNGLPITDSSVLESDLKYWKPKTYGECIFNWWD